MLFSFELDKPGDIIATFERLKHKLTATGGQLTGNEKEGLISAVGVKGEYVVNTDTITITVTKKPSPVFPNKLIEKRIRAIFQEISG